MPTAELFALTSRTLLPTAPTTTTPARSDASAHATPDTWSHRLLHAPFSESDRKSLPEAMRDEGRAFLDAFDRRPFELRRSELDAWYTSPQGQACLVGLFDAWWDELSSHADEAMPAHDARHAIARVPAAALECIAADGITGAGRLGVLGALFHDQGRWVEERLFGHPTESVFHARLSFVLARERLAGSGLPEVLAQEVMRAVLTHTSGADASDPLISRITVAADRDQLHGPEYILRVVHHLAMKPVTGFLPNEAGHSVVEKLLHMACNVLPSPSPWLTGRQAMLHADPLAFVMTALPASMLEPVFSAARRKCPEDWLQEAARRAACARTEPVTVDVDAWGRCLVDAPLVCAAPAPLEAMLTGLRATPETMHASLCQALAYAVRRRREEAARLDASLRTLAQRFEREDDGFAAHVARRLQQALEER